MKKSYVKRWLALSLVCSLSFATVAQADTLKENDPSVQETSESSANDPNVEEQTVITQNTEEPDISGQQDGWYTDPGSRDTYYYEMGVMVTDTVKEIEGNYYSFQSDGKLQKGWVHRAEGWYYADPASGVLKKGWQKIKNIWYYLKDNGVMATGWQQLGNIWYYLNGNGVMQTGSIKLNGTQYDLYKGNVRMPVQNGNGLNAFGSYCMTTGSMTEVNSAIQNFTKNGYRVGFCMIDLNSGNGIYYNSNMSFFSASVMKGAYVVSLNERIPNSAKKSEATMRKCIKILDNDAFTELKNTYGNVEYTKWVTEAGCKGINTKWKYIDITPRQLALLWAKNY